MRLIDADELKRYINSISSGLLCEWDTLGVLSAIDKQQAVDAVPVVRCKDCKYAHMTVRGECKYCDVWFPDEAIYADGDFFCANGKRKDGEQDGQG